MKVDDELIKFCVRQNRKAQKQLYKLLLPYLRAIANRYLRDSSYVKDVLQESFINIFKNIDKYDPQKASMIHWAARIVINSCLNYNERVIGNPKEEFTIGHHEIIILPDAVKKLSDEHLLFLLKQMPDDYFKVFNLFAIDGYSHSEIASLLSITEDLSRKRLSRARGWLKKTFRERPELINDLKSLPSNLN